MVWVRNWSKTTSCTKLTDKFRRERIARRRPSSRPHIWCAICLLGVGSAFAVVGTRAFCDEESLPRGVTAQRPEAAPRLSAVCFSSRWVRPSGSNDPHETFRAAEAFAATDFVWTYSLDPTFVQRAKTYGGKVFLAINSLVPDEPTGTSRQRGRIVDLEGRPVTAPWMRHGGQRFWGCVNSPEYRESYLAYAQRAIDAGCDGLQMDDPLTNLHAVQWGACFCRHCMEGFRDFLKERRSQLDLPALGIADVDSFDYRQYLRQRGAPVGDAFRTYDGGLLKELFIQFQRTSVERFFRDMRAALDAYAGRHVVFASNNYRGSWEFPYDLFEIGMAELPQRDATPSTMYRLFAEARRRGKPQIFTLVPAIEDGSEVRITRCAIATSYACGGHLIVPWDVYTGPHTPRYFGRPEDYADLYRFVRQYPHLFDEYEELAASVPGVSNPQLFHDGGGDVTLVLRGKPHGPRKEVVIHIIDWREEPQPLSLGLDLTLLGSPCELEAIVFQPGQEPQPCRADWGRAVPPHIVRLSLPALRPWAIVLIRPDPHKPNKTTIPIVYATDLFHPHDDPDDHFDLATLFALEEFDIRGIILDIGRWQKERPGTIPVSQMLTITGRKVPIAVGLGNPLAGPDDDGSGQPEEFQGGVRLLLDVLSQTDQPVVIFTTGSLRDIAAAYLRQPELLKAKVRRLYINIGDSCGGPEHNVTLDPWAYRVIMRSDLPVYWCPCFSGGLWRRDTGLATYWRFRHAEVLAGAPLVLQNFFLYAHRHESTPAIDYLSTKHPDHTYQWLFGLERNMWCTAPLVHAAGRCILEVDEGKFVAVAPWENSQSEKIKKKSADGFPRRVVPYDFVSRWIGETPEGQVAVLPAGEAPPPGARKVQCFEIRDPDRYQPIMTSVLAELFRKFPAQIPEPKP